MEMSGEGVPIDGSVECAAHSRRPALIREYVNLGLHKAHYEKLDDGSFVAEVPGLQGVLATGATLETCRDQLAEVLEEWVLVRVAEGLDVPPIDGVTVSVSRPD
jgi:predicted RNase H-like HicB family nuclease